MSERPSNPVVHVPDLPWIEPGSAPYGNGKTFAVRAKRLAAAAGGKQLGCSLYELHPGKRSFPFHYHLVQEEALYVLDGTATLRLGDSEVNVRAGDYVSFPAGAASAHQLINSGSAPVHYLCMSTTGLPEVAVYPDSKKVGVLGGAGSVDASGKPLVHLSPLGGTLGYYDGEDE
jgi:uncharacterized cupin superfamily protein